MTILAGYLPTTEGAAALRAAVDEARLRHEPLIVLVTGGEGSPELTQVAEAGIEYELVAARHEVPAGGQLVALAEERDVDLIVIGIRRRSPVGKLLLGSNAQDVLLTSNRTVLAVKAAEKP